MEHTTVDQRFRDRADAGRRLAQSLAQFRHLSDVIVLGLPRGGVPVAYEVAKALGAPLDVLVVRKLGVPGHEELAMGAVASGGVRVLNDHVLSSLEIPAAVVDEVTAAEQREIHRREREYRGDIPPPRVEGRTVILVDDGLATGSTMTAAVRAVRERKPARIIVAVPIAASETCAALRAEVDDIVCTETPEPFYAVGLWYENFTQTSDEEVKAVLEESRRWSSPPAAQHENWAGG